MGRSTVPFCNRLTRWRQSDKITALPTVTKESSNGDISGSGILRPEVYYSRLLQPALFGLQEVRGKLLPQNKLQPIFDSAEDRIQQTPGDTRHRGTDGGRPRFPHLGTPDSSLGEPSDAGTAHAREPRPGRPQGTAWSRGPRPISLGPLRAVGSSREALTHVLRVQLYGGHLLERNVASSAVPAAAQAAPRRRGHGAATQPRRSARARVLLGRGSFAARTETPGPGGEA